MNLKWSLMLIGVTVLVNAQAQVTFYSNPEPIHELSSSDSENYIYLSGSGNELLFTKEKSVLNVGGKSNPGDIWFARLHKSQLVDTAFVQSFNSKDLFVSPLGFTPDRKDLLYNQTHFNLGVYTGKVMSYSLETGRHAEVDIPHFKNSSQLQTGFLSRDGRHLLLSLERKSGYGVEDLYVCNMLPDGSWTAPKNLGYQINTELQEITPFLAEDNKTLYFATNARGGFGSFDLYVSTRLDDSWRNWSEPQNLGGMINSQGSETSLMFNAGSEYAYFVSTQNSEGYGDIKRIRIFPTPAGNEPDTVRETEILATKKAVFKVENVRTGIQLAFQYVGQKFVDGAPSNLGSYSNRVMDLPVGFEVGDSLDIEFKARGYLSESLIVTFDQLDSGINEMIVKLEPLETGNTIVLRHVLFHRGTPNFIESSMRELDLVVEMMEDNPDVKIFLKGHTDNIGNKVLNVELSRARVMAVKDYLVKHGVSAGRISGKGFGGSKPIASNDQEETRQLNRRVEFEVIRD